MDIWNKRFRRLLLTTLAGTMPFVFSHADEISCGPLENHYGPFDYRTTSPKDRALVENFHFTPKVETLQGGSTHMHAGGDINYLLKVFPNHHRALMATIRLSEKEKRDKPAEMAYTVECWFDRAERFRPDDAMVKALHGIYLIRSGKPQDGAAKLESSIELAGDDANIIYNLGLAYFDLKQYDKALESAHRAQKMGFPLPGLREKLKRIGKWREPSPVAIQAVETQEKIAPGDKRPSSTEPAQQEESPQPVPPPAK